MNYENACIIVKALLIINKWRFHSSIIINKWDEF